MRSTGFHLFFLFTLSLLFAGCGPVTVNPEPEIVSVQPTVPQWYENPPENTGEWLYGKGEGNTSDEAESQALENLVARLSSDLSIDYLSKVSAGKGVYRYLSHDDLQKMENILTNLPVSDYETLHNEKIAQNRYIALVRMSRHTFVKPLKREVVRRLVTIEESWLETRSSNVLERYSMAKRAHQKMVKLLPAYLLAMSIDPFSENIRNRIEQGLPYFIRKERSLKRRLSFCVEQGSTPALKLFTDAIGSALKKEKLHVVNAWDANDHTVCITIDGHFVHKKGTRNHIVKAYVDVKVHEPYQKPMETRRYIVKGISEESGTQALEKAARALEKALRKDFPFTG